MRNPNRIPVLLAEITILWINNCPDWRFMQLINNFMEWKKSDCFYMEDENFLEELKTYLKGLKKYG